MAKLISFCVLLLLATLTSCSESGPLSSEEDLDYQNELKKLFPQDVNILYEFNVDTLDNASANFKYAGKRFFEVKKKEVANGEEYNLGSQNYLYSDKEQNNSTMFRYSNNAVLFLTDTTGVTKGIPDSLLKIMTIKVDPEMNILELPLTRDKTWPVVKAFVDFQTFKFNTIDVVGEFIGNEELVLDGFENPFSTIKVRYKLDINAPNFDNPFLSNTMSYFAEVWFAEDYGIVKMEGCSFILNPVSGKQMDFIDTNKVSRHTLKNIINDL